MYTSRKARLYSENFHSLKNPKVPILNDRTGGTLKHVAKRDDARRIVPSPPRVMIRSILSCNADNCLSRGAEYTGNGREECTSSAVFGSRTTPMDGYVAVTWLQVKSQNTVFAENVGIHAVSYLRSSTRDPVTDGTPSFLTTKMFRGGAGH